MKISKELVIGILTLIGLLFVGFHGCFKEETKPATNIIQDDNRRDWIEDSVFITRVNSVSEARLKDFIANNSQDEEIKALTDLVKKFQKELKKGGSVTHFTTETLIRDSVTTITLPGEIIHIGDTVYVYPVYNSKLKNEWYSGSITADKGQIKLDSFTVFSAYNIIQGNEKLGWFKKRKFIHIENLNPYSKTLDARFYINEDKKRFSVGPSVFVGVNEVGITYGIGVSLTYKLWEF